MATLVYMRGVEEVFMAALFLVLHSPDPIPVLEQAVAVQQRLQSAQDHEVQNSKLRETLEEYKSEFAQVKSQGKSAISPPLSL